MLNQNDILDKINKNNSYIITGLNGSGKTSLAYEIVEKCIDPKYAHTFPLNYPDFHFLEGGKVDDVHDLLRKLKFKPFYDKHFVILDKINEMSIEGQNILLKTLEESDVMFVITCNNESKVLKTIFSRCYKITPNLLDKEVIYNNLILKYPLEKENYLENVSVLCDGSLGKAKKYVENENLKNFIENLQKLQYFNFLEFASLYENSKDDKDDIITLTEQYIKEKMLVSSKELRKKYFDLVVKIYEYRKHLYQNVSLKIVYRNIFMELINLEKLSIQK